MREDNGLKSRYVFWLYGPWDTHLTKTALFRCVVEPKLVQIDGPIPHAIPVSEIADVGVDKIGWGLGSYWYTWIKVVDRNELVKLWPANPLRVGNKAYTTYFEANALGQVIKAFHDGREPSLDENPYVRQSIADKQPGKAIGKSAEVNPAVYAAMARPRVWQVVLGLLLTSFVVLIAIWFVGLFF